MATVLVTGGSGTLGAHVTGILRGRGHEVRVLSRRPGAGTHQGDLATGDGVRAAADGAELVVHAASDTRRMGRKDLAQTRTLLDALSPATAHLLYVSIVGIDRIPYAYYRRKLACEALVGASAVPSTILRATQFHELIALVLSTVERWPLAPLPAGFRFQTIAAAEVAARVAALVEGPPVGRADDVGGPEVLDVSAMVRRWRAVRGRPRRTLPVPVPGRVGAAFRAGHHTCPDHAEGSQTWAAFVDALGVGAPGA
ncbi:MAG: SDR family oxidoreductase [Acidobacteriota bacterium]|nr:SDR family oxidoreductase [Acidobacteriota bacterium]